MTHLRSLKITYPCEVGSKWRNVDCCHIHEWTSLPRGEIQHLFQNRILFPPHINWCCKRGYFRRGKISRKCWQDIQRGFYVATPISLIKAYGFHFCMGVIFVKKTIARKLPPREKISTFTANCRLWCPQTPNLGREWDISELLRS